MRIGCFAAIGVVFLLLAPQDAAAEQTTFCVEYTVTINDATTSLGDDYWTSSDPKKARGAWFRIRNSGGTIIHGGYLNDDAPNIGCTSSAITLTDSATYTLELLSQSYVNGNHIRVRPEGQPSNVHLYDEQYTATGGTKTVTVTTGSGVQWTLAAIGGQALFRQDGGLTGETYNIFNGTSITDGTAWTLNEATDSTGLYGLGYCANGAIGDVCIYGWARNRKCILTHELGHAMAMKANADVPWANDYSALEGTCESTNFGSSHEMHTQEWGSAAAGEGLTGHGYAAAVWNDTSQSDCKFQYYKAVDVDDDGTWESQAMSCEGGFTASSWGAFDARDYYGDVPCSNSGANKGTEYDWMRFSWDMLSDEGLTWADMMSIWVAADPDTWWDSGDNYGNLHVDFPSQRIKDAADNLSFGAAYDDQASNGVDR